MSDSLSDFDNLPLVMLSHDLNAVFLADRFVDTFGLEDARAVSDHWEAGMDLSAGLSTDTRRVSVPDTGFDGVLWFRPDLVVDAVVEILGATE